LIHLMVRVAIGYGIVVVGIDFSEGMTVWWTLVEGPWISLSGVAVLLCGQHPTEHQAWSARLCEKCRGNLA
jgi:hypothetical protein